MRTATLLPLSLILLTGCGLVLGLDDFTDCTEGAGGQACPGTGGSGGTGGSSNPSTSTSPGCPTLSLEGDADRDIVVGESASVEVALDGNADSLVWEQLAGPEVSLPERGATAFAHTPPYVHDTLSLRVSAKREGCDDSIVEVSLTPQSDLDQRIYVSKQGDDTNAGTKAAPFATVEAALASATGPTEIVVGEGEYALTGALTIPEGVAIHGGYDASWHRAHHDQVTTLRLEHAFTSATLEPVFLARCDGACVLSGMTLELRNSGGTGQAVATVIALGPAGATIYENHLVRPDLDESEGHGCVGVSDTLDFATGGGGDLKMFNNVVDGGTGAPVMGVLLFEKADPLNTWIIASNYFKNTGTGDDSAAIYAQDSVTLVGNTFHVFDNDAGVAVQNSTVFANLFRGADGATPALGITCGTPAGGLDYNAFFGFTTPTAGSCTNITNTLTLDPLMTMDGHLQPGSPAIDYAPLANPTVDILPQWDRDGDLRRKGAGLDVGADEVE
ncbi:MAG: DUF1565 domain-containing protein [Polyangiaceae bacterium]|nr:DUF1565 domain-containing protein [Polyangiaceae bacterium]